MTSRVLSWSLFTIAAAVLVQGMLAGFFISGIAPTVLAHMIVGSTLPYVGLVPAVAVWRRRRQGVVGAGLAWATTLMLVALWVQSALGHMPFDVATAIHVPLGVFLFGFSLILGTTAHRAKA